jgi:hypothetical protein
MATTITLRQWRDAGHPAGYITVSPSIDQREKVKFISCNPEWWVWCPDLNGGLGRSFSCCPSTEVLVEDRYNEFGFEDSD